MWFAGIDWADRHHDVAVLDEGGRQVGTKRVAHSAQGLQELTTWLREIGGAPEQVACLIETTHGLLIAALLEAGFRVSPVNPKTVDRTRPPSGAKTDALDALLLARKGRSDWPDLRVLRPEGPLLAELKALTRDQQGLVIERTRLVNQLTACLKAYYPVALTWFDGLTRAITLTFLTAFPTPAQARAASEADLHALLAAAHYRHATEKAKVLHARLQEPQPQAVEAVVRAKARLTLALVAQLRVVAEHVAAYDEAIAALFAQHPDAELFASLPGAGRQLAPRLLAEWGDDRARYDGVGGVQALAGTAPVLVQSGNYRMVRRRRACVTPFREALYHFARERVLLEAWTRAFYARKRKEGKSRAMALRALANHWVRIVYAMWSRRTRYDPAVFLKAQHAHAPTAA